MRREAEVAKCDSGNDGGEGGGSDGPSGPPPPGPSTGGAFSTKNHGKAGNDGGPPPNEPHMPLPLDLPVATI
jgi:hypothetical protein